MVTLLRREFTVDIPLQRAWDHLARAEQWPSWAPHIQRIELHPPGELGPASTGIIHLANGIKTVFHVTEFAPPRNWIWVSVLLWTTLIYGHRFEALDAGHTRLTWQIEAQGFAASTLGRLFARIYRRHLDKAIPILVAEMNARLARA